MARSERERSRKRPQPPPLTVAQRRPRGPAVKPLIEMPPVTSFGPAMQALPTDAMRAFVIAQMDGLCQADAARAAGYSAQSPHALDVVGSRIANDTRVQAATLEMGQRLMRKEGGASIRTLVAIRDDKLAAAKDRIKCAVELLDRSGFHAIAESHISVEHRMTDFQKDQRILVLAQELGLDAGEAQKLLIDPSRVVEADFEEVRELTPEEIAEEEVRNIRNEKKRARRHMTMEERRVDTLQKRAAQSERMKLQHAAAKNGGPEEIEDALEDCT